MAEDSPDSAGTARLYYDLALWRLSEQNRAIESIEHKIASSIAVWGILIVLFVGLVAFGSGSGEAGQGGEVSRIDKTEWAWVTVVGVLFITSAFCAVRGYRIQAWNYGPKLSDLGTHARKYGDETMLLWVADALSEAQRLNEAAIERKGRWFDRSMWLSFIALAVVVGSILASSFPW